MQSIAAVFSIGQLCNMCTSKCGGACMVKLNNMPVNSDEALKELNDLLHNISGCGTHINTNKTLFMTEVINLKKEARKLLDEVNYNGERSPNGKLISTASYGYHNIFEDNSFRERLNNLKQRIRDLTARSLIK